MSRYFIKLSFNGRNYNGWQVQGNTPTVQKTLNDALTTIFRENIHTLGAGRTDTGVHAEEFYAHFDTDNTKLLATHDLRLAAVYKLNGVLPQDIAVQGILPVKNDAHARFDALSRTYKYYVSKHKDPFKNELVYFLYGKLNVGLMNEAANLLMEYKDFTSFAKLHTNTKTNNCKIFIAEWTEINDLLVFTIKADRFLRNMVRAVVGTLLDIGRGKIDINDFKSIIESKNRSDAGYSVPAHGLFLNKIEYPEEIFINNL